MKHKLPLLLIITIGQVAIIIMARFDPTPASPTKQIVSHQIFLPVILVPTTSDWPMVAANPERTSWVQEEVAGNLHVEWYRPIEAYIPQNVQIIASNGLLYISTARGLYALNAANGEVVWRFDTELPLGNSPTVFDGTVYVGGFDRKIHALNALDGTHLWAFGGAQAGFSTNPLVVDGKVLAGNRDGNMYAIGAHGTPNQGQLIWKYETGGTIHLSAAYKDGVLFFAANDNYAYALDVNTGTLAWKSAKLPGEQYQSYWLVIYRDKVILVAAQPYRHNMSPGANSVPDPQGGRSYNRIQKNDIWPGVIIFTTIGPTVPDPGAWAHGKTVIDGSLISEYYENDPNLDLHLHKPWRRVYIVLNRSDGSEYTMDVDNDGHPDYAPIGRFGTNSGNDYPPIVGITDDIVYQNILYARTDGDHGMTRGEIAGWKIGTPYFSIMEAQSASDEPQAISGGGNLIYRNICCDRVGSWVSTTTPTIKGTLWSYSLVELAPGYDEMWWGKNSNGLPGYRGNYGTVNGIYHNHGDQNPIIPYQGRLYIHRSNALIAFGSGQSLGKLPLLQIQNTQDAVQTLTLSELKARLEDEIQKMIAAGHLRPGYYNNGPFAFPELGDYFDNPGDTIYTLARAYPHVSSELQVQIELYLKNEFQSYFDPTMYARIGWVDGTAREAMDLPPEVEGVLPSFEKSEYAHPGSGWSYPQYNFYAMWKYSLLFPEDLGRMYDLAKSKIEAPVLSYVTDEYLMEKPWVHNAYIAGYIGFLELQELAGKTDEDSQLRTTVSNELDRLLELRSSTFTKDTYWKDSNSGRRTLNIARNFIMLVPELGDYLNRNALIEVQTAIDEYNFTGPYWFVSRYNAMVNEGVMQNLYDYNAIFQAKAYILKESRDELTKYLDVPAFERGDLFYIQNLIATIEAEN